jgi:hypothetical protein
MKVVCVVEDYQSAFIRNDGLKCLLFSTYTFGRLVMESSGSKQLEPGEWVLNAIYCGRACVHSDTPN